MKDVFSLRALNQNLKASNRTCVSVRLDAFMLTHRI